MSSVFWGILMMVIGMWMFISALVKSEFALYRLLAARSRILWGEHVHRFHMVSGILIIIVGGMLALGFF